MQSALDLGRCVQCDAPFVPWIESLDPVVSSSCVQCILPDGSAFVHGVCRTAERIAHASPMPLQRA